jgi:hypothetical protein
MSDALDLVGKKFTRLKVIAREANSPHGRSRWLVRCDCGVQKVVGGKHLMRGTTESCGCLNRDLWEARKLTRLLVKRGISPEDHALWTARGYRWCPSLCKAYLPAEAFYANAKSCKSCAHARSILCRYRVSWQSFENALILQKGTCGICGTGVSASRLCVDHDHACCSGEKSCGQCVRGLLCRPCNLRLANLESFLPEITIDSCGGWVKEAVDYMIRPSTLKESIAIVHAHSDVFMPRETNVQTSTK